MNKKILSCTVMAMMLSVVANVHAADVGSGTIEFNGTVNSGACTIKPESVNKEVQLGSVPSTLLKTAGAQGPDVNFALELSDCVLNPSGATGDDLSKVSVTFNGQMDPAGVLWANMGSAQNVGILFKNSNGVNLKAGDSVEQKLNAGANIISLSARMQALGAATAGSVKSTVAYVLNYQ